MVGGGAVVVVLLSLGCGPSLEERFQAIAEADPTAGAPPQQVVEQPVSAPEAEPPPGELEQPPPPILPVAWPVTAVDETHFLVHHDRLVTVPDEEWTRMRAITHRDATTNAPDGVRVSGIRRAGFAEALGLKNGDVLHAANGVPIEAPVDRPLRELLGSGERVELGMSRRGAPTTLVWETGVGGTPSR